MKKTKKSTTNKRASKKIEKVDASYTTETPSQDFYTEPYVAPAESTVSQPSTRRFPSVTFIVIFILLGIILGVLFAYQGMPVAALVNGQPIFRWELANSLFQRYGDQTLQGMVTEKLISDEASKSNVSITQSDIDTKAKQILGSFGSNMTVDDFLKFQGMKKTDFDNQIRLQLTVEKILSKDLTITDQDIEGYIATNRATLVATDPAKLKEEATNAIRDEKISEKVQEWLAGLKAKASIKSFL